VIQRVIVVVLEADREESTNDPSESADSESDHHRVRLNLRAGCLTGVLASVKSLLTNGPFVFIVLYGVFDAVLVNGYIAFGAKYIQQQFGLTATMAGVAFG